MPEFQQSRLELCFNNLLNEIGDDPKRIGLEKTPLLAARALMDLTKGYEQDPAAILRQERYEVPANYHGTIEIPEIAFMSLCEHTFLAFLGTVCVSYQPQAYIVGAGAFEKVIEAYSKRLQLQERLNAQVVELIWTVLEPRWVKVHIEAVHCCMNGRRMKTEVKRSLQE